jgi:hypothetical protein
MYNKKLFILILRSTFFRYIALNDWVTGNNKAVTPHDMQ